MIATERAGARHPASRPRSTQVVVFQESLVGVVRRVEQAPPQGDDRLECTVIGENVTPPTLDASTPVSCVVNLLIAVDVGAQTADGGRAGIVRSGRVHVDEIGLLTVRDGEFELLPQVPGDARRMRYRLWLRDPDGMSWYLRGTKLVVNETGGGLIGRIWTETTTLYIVLTPPDDGDSSVSTAPRAAVGRSTPTYTGVVSVRPADFARQLASLRGEPGPSGGLRAVWRLVATFWSVITEVYLHDRSPYSFAPGIDSAFAQVRDDS